MKKAQALLLGSIITASTLFGATADQTYIQELKQYLMTNSFAINGEFYPYDFEHDGTIDPNDWVYISVPTGSAYRLLATTPTEDNAFGFASVTAPSDLPDEPDGYFVRIDFPLDTDSRFSWVYAKKSTGNVYKLMGVTEQNTFDYLDINGDGVPDPLPNITYSYSASSSLPGTDAVPTISFVILSNGAQNAQQGAQNQTGTQTSTTTTTTTMALTPEQVYEVAYMWNEEKLAHDLYLNLYNLYANEQAATPLYNIATRSEIQHMNAVEGLLEKYDIDATNVEGNFAGPYDPNKLAALGSGEFSLSELQSLYDQLYAKGSQSLKDALEVGCIVEVTDVNDLDKALEIAGDNQDLVNVFTFLRNGSYNHYWAFDRTLKSIGVTQGCCALGDEYCKTPDEYPATNGGGQGGMGQGNGMGHGHSMSQ